MDGDTGCRRLWALIENLPPEASLCRDGDPWRDGDHILALLTEMVARALGHKLDIPRPGVEQEKPDRTNDPREIASWFGQHMT